ncbi:MAG: alpha/beta hydrolase [Ruminococcus sp.]|nr:alpha/beta hydrolase [Ruminococcus sp.]
MPFLLIGASLFALLLIVLIISYVCYRMAFLNPRTQEKQGEEFPIPEGEIYEPYREQMVSWMKEVRAMPCKEYWITSFDGLRLRGKYYEYAKGAPIELMFHGYRGTGERDLCGGVQRCFRLGRNVLIVDQRASGKSEGKVITFGINESRDCLAWVDLIIKEFGTDSKIILTGISMGAATVMMAAGKELPKNVICVLADCGYSSPKEIIKKVIKDMKLPENLAYPFVKLGAKVFGGFSLEETSAAEAMKVCKVPVIFIHGEDDDYVPCEMSRRLYEICKAPKVLVTVPGAGHGLAYLVDTEGYFKTLTTFCQKHNIQ